MALMSTRSWDDWVAEYAQAHQHPTNRFCHSIGIPMIAVSILVLVVALLVPGLWKLALALFVVGWVFQFVGHWIEGNSPAFFRNPVYLLVGPVWLARRALAAVGLIRPAGK